MRQRYDNAAKFVTAGYPEPFTGHILGYPNLIVLEELIGNGTGHAQNAPHR